MRSDNGVLYIEPEQLPSQEPVIDELTRGMAAAFRKATKGEHYRGFHVCECGAHSASCDYTLPGGALTNSLCVHYLAYHRAEVSRAQLAKVLVAMQDNHNEQVEPNFGELQPPQGTPLHRRLAPLVAAYDPATDSFDRKRFNDHVKKHHE
jgi:hypothetical protein